MGNMVSPPTPVPILSHLYTGAHLNLVPSRHFWTKSCETLKQCDLLLEEAGRAAASPVVAKSLGCGVAQLWEP